MDCSFSFHRVLSIIYIFWIQVLRQYKINNFSPVNGLSFHCPISIFQRTEVLIFMKSNLSNFHFYRPCFWCHLCLTQSHTDFLLWFLLKFFIVLGFIFPSIIHFCMMYRSKFISCMNYPVVPAPFLKKATLSLLNSLYVGSRLSTYAAVIFWTLFYWSCLICRQSPWIMAAFGQEKRQCLSPNFVFYF